MAVEPKEKMKFTSEHRKMYKGGVGSTHAVFKVETWDQLKSEDSYSVHVFGQ